MSIKTAYSTKQNIQEAVKEIGQEFKDFPTRVVIYFASSIYPPEDLASSMGKEFPVPLLFGCSTAGEMITGKMLKNSLVAMALGEEIIGDAAVEVVENLPDIKQVEKAFDSFSRYYSKPVSQMDPEEYVGIILIDGLSMAEEIVMDRIGDLTNLLFVGGSAADDLKFQQTHVYCGGKAYTNAAVLALLKPAVKFDIIKTQSFAVLEHKLTASRVKPEEREVLEFNGIPAVEAYSSALSVSPAEAGNYLMPNPVGLLVEQEVFVRGPLHLKGNSMVFACQILEGMDVHLLKATDILEDTRRVVEEKKQEMNGLSGLIEFNCAFRTLVLEGNNQAGEYGEIFSHVPTIGFSTYGEEYIGHINHTSTMLALGLPDKG